jgi:hypothetical protein
VLELQGDAWSLQRPGNQSGEPVGIVLVASLVVRPSSLLLGQSLISLAELLLDLLERPALERGEVEDCLLHPAQPMVIGMNLVVAGVG